LVLAKIPTLETSTNVESREKKLPHAAALRLSKLADKLFLVSSVSKTSRDLMLEVMNSMRVLTEIMTILSGSGSVQNQNQNQILSQNLSQKRPSMILLIPPMILLIPPMILQIPLMKAPMIQLTHREMKLLIHQLLTTLPMPTTPPRQI